MARKSNVYHREGTSSKYWYSIAGYLVSSVLALGYLSVMVVKMPKGSGSNFITGVMGAMVLFAVSPVGVGVYGALFKDSMYPCETGGRWRP